VSAPEADAAYRNRDLSVEERVADLRDRMTLEEKTAQLYCFGRAVELTDILLDEEGNLLPGAMAERFRHGICQLGRPAQRRSPRATAELTNAIQKFLVEETRLGIPAMFNEEGVHGLMATGSTSFPQALALASTWDEHLVEDVYTAVAREARVRGSNYVYAPVLDLARDPRWGRVEETFGEDPYLVSRLGVAAVGGLQGRGPVIDEEHVIACAKHYAVHGQPEGGLNAGPASISERVVREEFLSPFKAVVTEVGVQAVMASYNELDGIPAHANRWLLQTVLRDEWGFQGFVTSDGFGVPQLMLSHRTAADPDEAARRAIEAGIDCEVPAGICYPGLLEQAKAGKVSMRDIDRAVGNILRAKIRLGLLDGVPCADPDQAERVTNCPAHRQLALRAAQEAIVLLKNERDLLPLDIAEIRSVAVVGPNAADLHLGGYAEDPGRGTSVLEGIREKLGDRVRVAYAEGCRITEGVQGYAAWHRDEVRLSDPADDTPRIAEAVELARRSDVAVLVLGGNEGTCREGWWFNHLGDRDELGLLGRQEELVEAVLATGTPTIAVLINGRPLTVERLAENVPAILECWYLGQETGIAVAEVLVGEVNPSGKLPVTFPRSVGQLPVYYYHRPSAKRGYAFAVNDPLYPFGHGLSYTSFSYSGLGVSPERIAVGETTRVKVDVSNAGERAGAEIVQLYVRDQVSSVTRPVKALKGFRRIRLEPGESRSVEFELTPEQLALLDAEMQWRVEPGLFDVMVGSSSERLDTVTLEVVEGPRSKREQRPPRAAVR
jgi:beta-glucosidase